MDCEEVQDCPKILIAEGGGNHVVQLKPLCLGAGTGGQSRILERFNEFGIAIEFDFVQSRRGGEWSGACQAE